jgi:hypothetical protein
MPPTIIPNAAERVNDAGTDARRAVLYLIGGAIALQFVSGLDTYERGKGSAAVTAGLNEVTIAAWVGVYIVLAIAADFDTTRDLAVAFALLVFLATAYKFGPKAFNAAGKITQTRQHFTQKKGSDK